VRRLLAEAAPAAVKKKGSPFQNVFRRFLPKLGYPGALWVVAHRLDRLVWKILHDGVSYLGPEPETNPQARQLRAKKLAQALRKLGYCVTLAELPPALQPHTSARSSEL
jgi:hypothetical protein